MANACCSIELEPRTLSQGQLFQAREVAADAVQKLEPGEASTIFVKELSPVKEMEPIEENGHQEDDQEHIVDRLESPCQCSINTSNVESPVQINIKEPLSAPF